MHRITETYEADLSRDEKLFARTVQQFDPRRGSRGGHIIAALLGVALAAGWIIGSLAG